MTVNDGIVRELADRYFGSRMPQKFRLYLIDRYSDEPIWGEYTPEELMKQLISDADAYREGRLDPVVRTPLQRSEDQRRELGELISQLQSEQRRLEKENEYMQAFIPNKHLEDEYERFTRDAHYAKAYDRDTGEELPFPILTM